jgi:crotonobetainyl-CoA:carnitine CoA-transferase CaiB-like acyl-CoA transferase
MADLSSAMFAAVSILAALQGRAKASGAQYLDVSMTDGMLSWNSVALSNYLDSGIMPKESGHASYGIFRTKDDKYISLGVIEDWFWENLCRAINREELLVDRRFVNMHGRDSCKAEINKILAEIFVQKNQSELLRFLTEADIPVAPVNFFDQIESDPYIISRGLIIQPDQTSSHKQVRFPVIFDSCQFTPYLPPPELGEHTEGVLRNLGYTTEAIGELRKLGVI